MALTRLLVPATNSNTATDNGSAGLPVSDDQAVQALP